MIKKIVYYILFITVILFILASNNLCADFDKLPNNPKPITMSDDERLDLIEMYYGPEALKGYSIALARVTSVTSQPNTKYTKEQVENRLPQQHIVSLYPIRGEFTTIKLLYGKPIPEINKVDNSDAINAFNDPNTYTQRMICIPSSTFRMRLGEYWIIVYDPVKKRIDTSVSKADSPLTGNNDPLIDTFIFYMKYQKITDTQLLLDKLKFVLDDEASTNLLKNLTLRMVGIHIDILQTDKSLKKDAQIDYNKILWSLLLKDNIDTQLRVNAIKCINLNPDYVKTDKDTILLCQYMMNAFTNSNNQLIVETIYSCFCQLLQSKPDNSPKHYYFPDIYNLIKSKTGYRLPRIKYDQEILDKSDLVIRIPSLGNDDLSKAILEVSKE